MRKAIAEHMVRSVQTAAHCTTIVEVDFSAVAKRRAELKPSFAEKGVPLTYLAFVARAVVESLEEFPALNASVDGDDIVRHPDVNLGIAVSLDAGLIVPVIPKAQRLSLEGIAAAIADVAGRARDGQARAGRGAGRHVHDHQPRPVRRRARDADHQPAAGGDPGPRGDREAPGRAGVRRPATRSRSARWDSCRCPGTTAPWTAPRRRGSSARSRRGSRRRVA